jgi:hypothetical protein
MLIVMPIPPRDHAFEKTAIIAIMIVHTTISISNPH